MLPLSAGHLLTIGVTSYNGEVFFGLTADRYAIRDLDVLAQCLRDALEELLDTTVRGQRRAPADPQGLARRPAGPPPRRPRRGTSRAQGDRAEARRRPDHWSTGAARDALSGRRAERQRQPRPKRRRSSTPAQLICARRQPASTAKPRKKAAAKKSANG